jgi:hypothetical protein
MACRVEQPECAPRTLKSATEVRWAQTGAEARRLLAQPQM